MLETTLQIITDMNQTTIEILYVISFGLIALFTILAYTRKMSIGIALISILAGLGIAWLFAPYMEIVISPIGNWIIYGFALDWYVIVAIAHLVSLFTLVIIAGSNLFRSGGKIIWA